MKCSFSILPVKNVLHQIIHLLKRQSNLGVSQQNIRESQNRKDLSVMNPSVQLWDGNTYFEISDWRLREANNA